MPLTITGNDLSKSSKFLDKMENRMKNLKKPLAKAGKELAKDFFGKKVFQSKGSAIGESWKPLKASTLVARSKGWGHYSKGAGAVNKMLVWTGAMSQGFTPKASPHQLDITNKVFYFQYNQEDRPMLAINDKVVEIVVRHVDEFLSQN